MTEENVTEGGKQSQTSLSLLECAKRDESVAWQLLVDLYAPVIYARCRYQWKLQASEAENVGQEVFTAVARKLKDFDRQRTGSFRRWLRTITDNKCKDFIKKNKVLVASGGSEAREALENIAEETINESHSAGELNDKAILMRQAMKKVENEFSDRDCKIFWAVSVDDKDRQAVASELGVSDNVVYLAYSRIKSRLREIYQDLIDDEIS